MQIYVGNLPPKFGDEDLRKLFKPFGKVRAATVVIDKKTEKSEEYGFVEMPVKSEARKAVNDLRGKDMKGKPLRVKALKPDDEFHRHAMNLHGGASQTNPSMRQFKGDTSYRGSGAIRRGGKRGS